MDETWIHCYTLETKEQPKQWVVEGERAPKKAKTVKSAGKVMATVFWDTRGIIYTDYLEKGLTITGAYYAFLLYRIWHTVNFFSKLEKMTRWTTVHVKRGGHSPSRCLF